jgi:hypothetical protein
MKLCLDLNTFKWSRERVLKVKICSKQIDKTIWIRLTIVSFVTVDKTEEMIGSYGPNADAYEKKFQTEEAPSGMLARGHYEAKVNIVLPSTVVKYPMWTFTLTAIHINRASLSTTIILLIWSGPGLSTSRRTGKGKRK